MAEWFVGPTMEKIIKTCFRYLEDQFIWQGGMKKELERLRENYPKIQAVVFASSQAQIRDHNNPALNKWIWQLRDAIDEADDLLDELDYMKHEEQLTKNTEKTKKRKVSSFLFQSARKILKVGERVLKIDPNLNRLVEVVQKLDKVSAEVGTFLHLLESTKLEQQEQELELYKTRETGSLPKNDIIGRGKDKEFVMQWLRKASNEEQQTLVTGTDLYRNISLLSIVGHGGMGKTALLQHVYEDEMTKEFHPKMWACVSNNFDVKRVIADMLETIKMNRPPLESLDALQKSLKSEVMSKKFLIVLDDIWEDEEERDKSKWENVLAPLAYGSFGSKILVTTRMDSVALMIAKVIKNKKETLRLEGLEENECLHLLNTHAFADVENPNDHKKLRSIAGEIVKKLSGSPLAAKIIGGVLNSSLDEMHWRTVLKSNFSSTKFGQNDIFSILRLSYIFLPNPLKSCFAFCCIFAQDHKFDKDDLVRMWIAVGFIQPSHISGETMEDIGGRYFDILAKKSFFDKFQTKNGTTVYKMHDLLHELAESVSIQESLRVVEELPFVIPETIRHLSVETRNLDVLKKVENFKKLRTLCITYYKSDQDFIEKKKKKKDLLHELAESVSIQESLRVVEELPFVIPETIRHLSVETRNLDVLKKVENFKKLRTLCITYYKSDQDFIDVLTKIFKASRSIRLLRLNVSLLKMMPEVIGYLIHLRYFGLDYNYVTMLPRSLGNLYHLQFITVNCNGYLCVDDNFLPRNINNLSNLHYLELPGIVHSMIHGIGRLNSLQELKEFSLRNEFGHRIGELEHMNDLRKLKIKFLENVKDVEEACSAKLCDKRNLMDLSLEWGVTGSRNLINLDEKVLDSLQPQKYLKNLRIQRYMGARSAIWMNNANLISNLEYIHLDNCLEWETLPPFGQLPFLKSLRLIDLPKVKRLDNKFHGNDKDCVFLSLEVLHINGLKALENWFDTAITDDYFFPCLTELELNDCPKLKELPSLPPKLKRLNINDIGWKTLNCCSISQSISLEELDVRHCPNITYISMVDEIAGLKTLRNLIIKDCPNLISLGGHQEVETTNCQLILSYLNINDPSVLLMEPLRSMTSLQRLNIEWNDELVSFPNEAEQWFLKVSSSLRELSFGCLNSLQSLPYTLESLSSLENLSLYEVPQLELLPNIPTSLKKLSLVDIESLQYLPYSLSTISSLKYLQLDGIPLLKSLPDLPHSLCKLCLCNLENLVCLPSCIPSLSSLQTLDISGVPKLRELPDLPPSLCELDIVRLDNLDCLPSCLPTLSSLQKLSINKTPQLQALPDLPPSLREVHLKFLENLDCLPSCLPSLSSLQKLDFYGFPKLRELPDLPPSLCELHLARLDNLDCLPSCLSTLSSLQKLHIDKVPKLRELPDLPLYLKFLKIQECHPELKERFRMFEGSDWHKIAHIPHVHIDND